MDYVTFNRFILTTKKWQVCCSNMTNSISIVGIDKIAPDINLNILANRQKHNNTSQNSNNASRSRERERRWKSVNCWWKTMNTNRLAANTHIVRQSQLLAIAEETIAVRHLHLISCVDVLWYLSKCASNQREWGTHAEKSTWNNDSFNQSMDWPLFVPLCLMCSFVLANCLGCFLSSSWQCKQQTKSIKRTRLTDDEPNDFNDNTHSPGISINISTSNKIPMA